MAAATSVIVLDRSNNTTCTINLHGKNNKLIISILYPAHGKKFSRLKMKNMKKSKKTKKKCFSVSTRRFSDLEPNQTKSFKKRGFFILTNWNYFERHMNIEFCICVF